MTLSILQIGNIWTRKQSINKHTNKLQFCGCAILSEVTKKKWRSRSDSESLFLFCEWRSLFSSQTCWSSSLDSTLRSRCFRKKKKRKENEERKDYTHIFDVSKNQITKEKEKMSSSGRSLTTALYLILFIQSALLYQGKKNSQLLFSFVYYVRQSRWLW